MAASLAACPQIQTLCLLVNRYVLPADDDRSQNRLHASSTNNTFAGFFSSGTMAIACSALAMRRCRIVSLGRRRLARRSLSGRASQASAVPPETVLSSNERYSFVKRCSPYRGGTDSSHWRRLVQRAHIRSNVLDPAMRRGRS